MGSEPEPAPRSAYSVPLLRLSVSFDNETNALQRVRIASDASNDYTIITPLNDERVVYTRKGRETTVYRETWESAWMVTDFEREQLIEVVHSLVQTLEGFERDLARERFDRILYLDAFLPRFLRGFYYLCEAIRNHHDPLPRVTRIPESAYDVSLNSLKSDERITEWRTTHQHIMKLRIVSKEFAYQLDRWARAESRRKKPDPARLFTTETLKAYSLFVRVYFNLNPVPGIEVP